MVLFTRLVVTAQSFQVLTPALGPNTHGNLSHPEDERASEVEMRDQGRERPAVGLHGRPAVD
jgi:hypothetical protein